MPGAGLGEEARPAALDAAFALGKMAAIKKGMPQPRSAEQVLAQPWAGVWNGGAALLRTLIDEPQSPCENAVEYLFRFSQQT